MGNTRSEIGLTESRDWVCEQLRVTLFPTEPIDRDTHDQWVNSIADTEPEEIHEQRPRRTATGINKRLNRFQLAYLSCRRNQIART